MLCLWFCVQIPFSSCVENIPSYADTRLCQGPNFIPVGILAQVVRPFDNTHAILSLLSALSDGGHAAGL